MVNAQKKWSQVESKPSPAVAAMAVAAAVKGAAIQDAEGGVDAEEELEGDVERRDYAVPIEEGWNGR
jgi:hypothetical protein